LGTGEESWPTRWYHKLFEGIPFLSYAWSVDIFMAGILGVGLYFWFSGRVWCRFACPSLRSCTFTRAFLVTGFSPTKANASPATFALRSATRAIDVMNFANKGLPMEDPECVRCSACVQQCPTGVLSFGRYDNERNIILDRLPAFSGADAESNAVSSLFRSATFQPAANELASEMPA
jgi:ferredoxin